DKSLDTHPRRLYHRTVTASFPPCLTQGVHPMELCSSAPMCVSLEPLDSRPLPPAVPTVHRTKTAISETASAVQQSRHLPNHRSCAKTAVDAQFERSSRLTVVDKNRGRSIEWSVW